MTRHLPRLAGPLAAALLLAGCSSSSQPACPGTPLATFDLQAICDVTLTKCSSGGEPAGGWASQVPAFIPNDPLLRIDDHKIVAGVPAVCSGVGPSTADPAKLVVTVDGREYGPASTFAATLSTETASGTFALCTGRRLASDLTGTRTGDTVKLSASTTGAVVGGCAATCAATLDVTVELDLVDPATPGDPLAFKNGKLTESLKDPSGGCDSCVLPCTSTYTLTGTAR